MEVKRGWDDKLVTFHVSKVFEYSPSIRKEAIHRGSYSSYLL